MNRIKKRLTSIHKIFKYMVRMVLKFHAIFYKVTTQTMVTGT